jgi:hypothetical protein
MDNIKKMESCESFSDAFTWNPFLVSCSESQVCMKTVTILQISPDHVISRTVRGCAMRNDSLGNEYTTMQCGQMVSARFGPSDTEYNMHDEICTCDTNHCNSALPSKITGETVNWIVMCAIGIVLLQVVQE